MPAASWRIEPGAHHQLVADRLGSGRVFLDGGKQKLTGAHAGLPICRLWVWPGAGYGARTPDERVS